MPGYPSDATVLPPFPAQPDGVPWPTDVWPRGELRPSCDRAAIDAHLDHAFSPDVAEELGDTSAVLVVQSGRIVVERYAAGVDPGATFPSWSMAKSILAAGVGIEVRDGLLPGLDATTGWPGWTEEEDQRRRLTLRDLLRMKASLEWAEEY